MSLLDHNRIRVDRISYESKTTDKRQQNDCRAKKNLGGLLRLITTGLRKKIRRVVGFGRESMRRGSHVSIILKVFFLFSSFVMVFLCLGLSVFSTIENHEYEVEAEAILFNLEIVIVIWFGCEFVVR